MASLSPTLALIRSAFGPNASLYDALSSSKDTSQTDLKKAYRKLALKYHPDKQARSTSNKNNDSSIQEATVKFQAVSAAYQVLRDEKQRAVYDATGRVEDCDDRANTTSERGKQKHASDEQRQRRWDNFFRSVFNDILTADSKYGSAETYRISVQEQKDVLKYYTTCKGDLQMVLNCVVHGSDKDFDRWKKDIILPAIERGDIQDYCGITNCKSGTVDLVDSPTGNSKSGDLVDSDEEDNNHRLTRKRKKHKTNDGVKIKRLKGKPQKAPIVLIDSDDDDQDDQTSRLDNSSSLAMNRRDKMEYRVAKKRKLKAKREIEIANIMKSKNWAVGEAMKNSMGPANRRNRTGVTNEMLLNMEKKYSKDASSGIRKKIRRKK